MPSFFSSYDGFIAQLADHEYFGQKLGLDRMQETMERLGRPENSFRSIHVAGTNGKGSTAAMLASVLRTAGYRVGLYTSPHLEDFRERIRIGEDMISEKDVMELAALVESTAKAEGAPGEGLTFFETSTAIAFLYFAREKVDFAVVEVGLGGRLDATNVITPLVSIITSIGHDHQQHLGPTLRDIAREKAGILKPGVPLVVGGERDVPPEAFEVIRDEAAGKHPACAVVSPDPISENTVVSLKGEHQRRNAAAVKTALRILKEKHGVEINEKEMEKGLNCTSWPGRLETVTTEPWILLDGAHNPEAMRVVREYLDAHRAGRRVHVVFAAMADKDYASVFHEIAPLADDVLLTRVNLKRSAAAEDLAAGISVDFKNPKIFPDVESVFAYVQKLPKADVVLVTGSFFLVGEFRNLQKKTMLFSQ